MRKINAIVTMVALLVFCFTSFASTLPVNAGEIRIGDEVQDPNYDPFEYPYFADLHLLSIEDARKVDTLGNFCAFDDIVEWGENFCPNKTFTHKQFKIMIRNLFDVKITITEPKKACTANWIRKQMKKVYKKLGVPFNASKYLSGSKKLTRLEVARELYKLFDEFDWWIYFCILNPADLTSPAATANAVKRYSLK